MGVSLGKRGLALLFAGLLCLGLVVFGPALRSYFVSDDFLLLAQAHEEGLAALQSPPGRFLRPVVTLSFLADHAVWGLRAGGFHLTNVAIHALNACLVTLVAASLAGAALTPRGSARAVAVLSGLVYLLLPCHSESVCWVSGRTDLIAACFQLVALAACCRAPTSRQTWHRVLSPGAFSLALLAKETAIAFPFVMLVVACVHTSRLAQPPPATPHASSGAFPAFLFRKKALLRAARDALPFFAVLAVYFLVRRAALGSFIGGYGVRGHFRFTPALLADCLSRFALRSVCPPLPTGICNAFAPHQRLLSLATALVMFLLLITLAYSARRTRRAGPLLLVFLCFWASLLPVCNVRIHVQSTIGERFLYFPTVFTAIGIPYVLMMLSKSVRFATLLVVFFAGFSATRLYGLSGDWRVAGTMTRSIARGIAAQANHDTVYLVNRPDTYHGAYVFRTGLQAAVGLFSKTATPRSVRSIFAQRIDVPGAQVSLERSGASPDTYVLSLLDNGSQCYFADPTYADLLETLPQAATFCFREPLKDADLFYYTAGDIKEFVEVRPCVPPH